MLFSRSRIAEDFGRAAHVYSRHADLQLDVAKRLLENALISVPDGATVLDVGAGPAVLAQLMGSRPEPCWQIISLDLAEAMCREAHRVTDAVVCADMGEIPLPDASVDVVWSSLALQWTEDVQPVLEEWYRVLRPGGKLVCATFGPATLQELRQAFESIEGPGSARVSQFVGGNVLSRALEQSGFCGVQMISYQDVRHYDGVMHLLRTIRAIGAENKRDDRPRSLTGKRVFSQLEALYPQQKEGIFASWDVICIEAKKDS